MTAGTGTCPLCGGGRSKVLFESPRKNAGTIAARVTTDVYDDYGRVLKCRDCGFVRRDAVPEEEDVLSSYRGMEDEDYAAEAECRSINAHLSLRAIKRHAKGGRLLDVGCSCGYLLNAARVDFKPEGVEPSAWAAEKARVLAGVPVAEGSLAEARFAEGKFDVVSMVDVLEHVTDPGGFVREARRVLKAGGLLYIVTPDIESLSARLLGRYWWGLRSAHLSYFSRATLRKLLEKEGFEVREETSYGRAFTYGYWVSRVKGYPAWFRKPLGLLAEAAGGADKVAYINTRDSVQVCAIKK